MSFSLKNVIPRTPTDRRNEWMATESSTAQQQQQEHVECPLSMQSEKGVFRQRRRALSQPKRKEWWAAYLFFPKQSQPLHAEPFYLLIFLDGKFKSLPLGITKRNRSNPVFTPFHISHTNCNRSTTLSTLALLLVHTISFFRLPTAAVAVALTGPHYFIFLSQQQQ